MTLTREMLDSGRYRGRTRPVADINRKLRAAGTTVEEVIDGMLAAGVHPAVLEIGFGWGTVLIELAARFRDDPVTLHGINLERIPPVERSSDLAAVAEALGIVPADELDSLVWPRTHFYDATDLQFPDESLDFVYSAVTMRFIADKVRTIEEVARALRPGGRALLHIGEARWEYDAGPAADELLLTDRPCRLVLHSELQLVPLQDYLPWAAGPGYRVRVPAGRKCVIDIAKLDSGPLDLGLTLDARRTIAMADFPHPDRSEGTDGVRSTYTISSQRLADFRAATAA